MRADEMKPGMWIRRTESGMPFRLTKYDSKHYGGWYGERLADGAECFLEPSMCQRWVPKLGEFVRVAGCEPFVVTAVESDRAYGQLARGLVTSVAIGVLEPAPMPKTPTFDHGAMRTPIGAEAEAAGVADRYAQAVLGLPGLQFVWTPSTAVVNAAIAATPVKAGDLVFSGASGSLSVKPAQAVLKTSPKASADRCKVCGGGVYVGLNDVECKAGAACKPVQTEPRLRRVPVADSRGFSEMHWRAEGRGQWANHPTEEGAIAAWREKVRQ